MEEETMLLILTLVPLAMGLLVVVMALLKKLKPQTVAEETNVADRHGDIGNPIPIGTRHGTDRLRKEEKKEVLR
jgi:hypothetical protein